MSRKSKSDTIMISRSKLIFSSDHVSRLRVPHFVLLVHQWSSTRAYDTLCCLTCSWNKKICNKTSEQRTDTVWHKPSLSYKQFRHSFLSGVWGHSSVTSLLTGFYKNSYLLTYKPWQILQISDREQKTNYIHYASIRTSPAKLWPILGTHLFSVTDSDSRRKETVCSYCLLSDLASSTWS